MASESSESNLLLFNVHKNCVKHTGGERKLDAFLFFVLRVSMYVRPVSLFNFYACPFYVNVF